MLSSRECSIFSFARIRGRRQSRSARRRTRLVDLDINMDISLSSRLADDEGKMAAIVIRNLSPETHRALQARAVRHRRSTEAEARAILDEAVRPPVRIKLGSALAALAQPLGGLDLDIARDETPAEPVAFR
jgi:antitoxin FitA